MDDNQNSWNHQNNDNSQWDKWNSNASNSSYYNQPTHRPYGMGFTIASVICGLMSITACCTGILSLPLGALGILFAALTYRRGKNMNSLSVIGIVSSCAGIFTAILMTVYSFVMMPTLLKNEAFASQLNTLTQQMYGMDFKEFMEEFYGYSFD